MKHQLTAGISEQEAEEQSEPSLSAYTHSTWKREDRH